MKIDPAVLGALSQATFNGPVTIHIHTSPASVEKKTNSFEPSKPINISVKTLPSIEPERLGSNLEEALETIRTDTRELPIPGETLTPIDVDSYVRERPHLVGKSPRAVVNYALRDDCFLFSSSPYSTIQRLAALLRGTKPRQGKVNLADLALPQLRTLGLDRQTKTLPSSTRGVVKRVLQAAGQPLPRHKVYSVVALYGDCLDESLGNAVKGLIDDGEIDRNKNGLFLLDTANEAG